MTANPFRIPKVRFFSARNPTNNTQKKSCQQIAVKTKAEERGTLGYRRQSMGRFNDPTIYPLVYPPDQANPALLVYVTKGMERSTDRGLETRTETGSTQTERDAEDTSQSSCLYYLYFPVLSHFPSKICELEILDFRSVTRHRGAVVHMHVTKDDNTTKHPTLCQKVNTTLGQFNTSAF